MRPFISIETQSLIKSSRKEDLRYADYTEVLTEKDPLSKAARGILLAGYPDDSGTELNGGRTGAKEGPATIRKYFYKTTPTLKNPKTIFDLGNLRIEGDLGARHELAKETAREAFKNQIPWVSIGGSHDYAYADGSAFLMECTSKKKRPLIINFDAHLDCRPTDSGLNSGTPFYRLLSDYDFDFFEIGLQSVCNSRTYLNWAKEQGAKCFFIDDLTMALKALKPALKVPRPVWLSIDLDVFASAYAPGTSNNWPFGMTPREFTPFFDEILASDLRGLGLYEVVPKLDVDNITSKLSAQLIHRFVESRA